MGLLADAMTYLGDIAAKRHRLPGLGVLAGQVQLDFMAHHVQGGVVENGVVEQQGRGHPPSERILGKHQAQQRRLAQVHTITTRIEINRLA